jgi:uncharacterized alpha-E superfamily protein
MYRKRRHRISPQDVAQFLISEREFPRSIQFCLIQAEKSLCHITGGSPGIWGSSAERNLGKLRSQLDFITIEEIMQSGLHEFLDDIEIQLNQVGYCIFEKFFDIQSVA